MPALSTTLALTLRPAKGAAAPVHGWFVSGSDPGEWLHTLLEAGLKLEDAGVMIMPDGTGALFSIPHGAAPAVLPRAIPFTCRHGRLWMPCDAVVSPSLTPDEVTAMCPWGAVVWHPAHPPAAFEASEILPVSGLVRAPAHHSGPLWTGAVSVDPMLSEVRNVRLALVFDEKTIFREEERRIGKDPPQDLPGMKGPSKNGGWREWIAATFSSARRKSPKPAPASGPATGAQLPRWLIAVLGVLLIFALVSIIRDPSVPPFVLVIALLVFLMILMSRIIVRRGRSTSRGGFQTPRPRSTTDFQPVPSSGGMRGWLNRVSEEMMRRRWKAVDELLEELKRDPEKALRRALPLNSSALHRGTAAPGDQLNMSRSADFSMSGLRGGGPVDSWDLPHHYQQALRAQYVAQAQAEARRGNHRAAAYIHAHLLGDLHAAAAALRAGGHFREAATLYRTRLNNLPAAAECLASGGLHVEAAGIYEELGQHNSAGDEWKEAGDLERAHQAWRKAVQEFVDRQAVTGAATLLERKLDAPEEALALLISAWPDNGQATAALLAAYDLMAQRKWPGQALELTRRLCATPPQTSRLEGLAKILTGISRAWPDALVRETAKEGALGLIASQFQNGDAASIRRAGENLAALEAGDKLLSGDIARFTNLVREEERSRAQAKPKSSATNGWARGLTIEHRGTIDFEKQFPGGEFLTGISGDGNELYVLAVSPHRPGPLLLLGGDWHDKQVFTAAQWLWCTGLSSKPSLVRGPHSVLMICGPELHSTTGGALQTIVREKSVTSLSAGRPSWMHGRTETIAVCGDLWCLGAPEADGIHLHFFDGSGQLRASKSALYKDWPPSPALTALAAHGQHVIMAVERGLMILHNENVDQEALPSPPLHLAVSPSWASLAIAAGCANGAYLYLHHSQQRLTLDADMAQPLVGFTGRNQVIALNEKEGVVAQTEGGAFTRFQRFRWIHGKPVAILQHPDGDTCGVLTSKGRVEIIRIRESG